MKKISLILVFALVVSMLAGCAASGTEGDAPQDDRDPSAGGNVNTPSGGTDSGEDAAQIVLSPDGVSLNGEPLGEDPASPAYVARDIVYYMSGQGAGYGEGSEDDAHSEDEARSHLVLHISAPGTYVISGEFPRGQIAVDLGEDARSDPNAVVSLELRGVNIACSVAPAIIFYNVYECGPESGGGQTVDTSKAGANILISDGTENSVSGSYVSKILDPDTGEKLHKYDGAVYSRMSMNVSGSDGVLNISAGNEGLDSELHLTINGGVINIDSANDGINTNADGVSVTTVNGGELNIAVNSEGQEGDGIDSNGYIVINGGTVRAFARAGSPDSGLDSDLGTYINGGTVIATGDMPQDPAGGGQEWRMLSFQDRVEGGALYSLRSGSVDLMDLEVPNAFRSLLISTPTLKDLKELALYLRDVLVGSSPSPGPVEIEGPITTEPFNPPPDATLPVEPPPPLVTK